MRYQLAGVTGEHRMRVCEREGTSVKGRKVLHMKISNNRIHHFLFRIKNKVVSAERWLKDKSFPNKTGY